MRAAYYYKLLEQGDSIHEVARRFNLTVSKIKEALHTYHLYQMACRIELPQPTLDKVRNPRKFNLTTLGRIFESPTGQGFFGVELRDDGIVQGNIEPEEFKKGFTRVVKDVACGDIDSRRLNKEENIREYLETFPLSEKPNQSKKGSFDSTNFLKQATTSFPKKPLATRKKTSGTKTPSGLIPKGFQCNINNPRVKHLVDELQRLSPEKFPNACAVTFRCFLEVSTYCFLEAKGEIAKILAEEKKAFARKNAGKEKKGKFPSHWTPGLTCMLKWIAKPNHHILPQGHVTKALGAVIKDEEIFRFNLFAHNPNI